MKTRYLPCTLGMLLLILSASGNSRAFEENTPQVAPETEALEAEFAALEGGFKRSFSEYNYAERQARQKGESIEGPHPAATFFPRMEALAQKGVGKAVYWCLVFEAHSGRKGEQSNEFRRALYELVVRDHARAAFVENLPRLLRNETQKGGIGRRAAADICSALAEKVEGSEEQASMLYHAARLLSSPGGQEAEIAQSVVVFRELLKRFPESKPAPRARGAIFKHENLNIGQQAPDFEALDSDDVAFKLSDYRGKVVVLTFWGFWCPPCRRMMPHEKELVARLADQPFALIGFNTDKDKGEFMSKAADFGVTWRNSWQGQPGEIPTR